MWKDLPTLGVQDTDGAPLELRNCVCGSTLAVEMVPCFFCKGAGHDKDGVDCGCHNGYETP